MRIHLHGGNCCGIKHIHEMGNWPAYKLAARNAATEDDTSYSSSFTASHDMIAKNPHPIADFFNEAAPEEMYRERFKRFVHFIKKNRPHGLIEVVLTSNQKRVWAKILAGHGFREVSTCKNSNTTCKIYIFHLAY